MTHNIKTLGEIDAKLPAKKEYFENLFDVKIGNILVMVLSKEEFSRLGREDWVVGFAVPRKNLIFVIRQEESGRDYEEWLKIIVHELVHLFYLEKFRISEPAWFFEGLACNLAGQKKIERKIGLKDLLEHFSGRNKDTYGLGSSIIEKILRDDKND